MDIMIWVKYSNSAYLCVKIEGDYVKYVFSFIHVERFGAWSSSGCREVVRDGNNIVCECSQLGQIGLLFVSLYSILCMTTNAIHNVDTQ